ncbi:hypothetical protein ACS0TY_006573 [Phlomoides rotata]
MGYIENSYVSSSLISSYARNGLVSDALIFVGSGNTKLYVVSSNIVAWIYNRTGQYEKTQELYAEMENPDSISWNLLIAACSGNSDYNESFELFDHMRKSQVYPDKYTFVSLFNVCTKLCNLALGRSLHGLIVKTNFKICDTFVCNTVIDMYGKCRGIESSVKIFDGMTEHNIISWMALVSTLGLHEPSGNVLVDFEACNGIEKVVVLIRDKQVAENLRMKLQGVDECSSLPLNFDSTLDADEPTDVYLKFKLPKNQPTYANLKKIAKDDIHFSFLKMKRDMSIMMNSHMNIMMKKKIKMVQKKSLKDSQSPTTSEMDKFLSDENVQKILDEMVENFNRLKKMDDDCSTFHLLTPENEKNISVDIDIDDLVDEVVGDISNESNYVEVDEEAIDLGSNGKDIDIDFFKWPINGDIGYLSSFMKMNKRLFVERPIHEKEESYTSLVDVWCFLMNKRDKQVKPRKRFCFNSIHSQTQMVTFLKTLNHPKAEELFLYEIENVNFSWQTKKEDMDCGIFLMNHLENFEGTIYENPDLGKVR